MSWLSTPTALPRSSLSTSAGCRPSFIPRKLAQDCPLVIATSETALHGLLCRRQMRPCPHAGGTVCNSACAP